MDNKDLKTWPSNFRAYLKGLSIKMGLFLENDDMVILDVNLDSRRP